MLAGFSYPKYFLADSPKEKGKSYAAPSTQLMENPFKAAEPKKKGKKGKK